MRERTGVVRFHEAERAVVDGDGQQAEVVGVADAFGDGLQISIRMRTNVRGRRLSFLPCANPTDIHSAIRRAVSFTTDV